MVDLNESTEMCSSNLCPSITENHSSQLQFAPIAPTVAEQPPYQAASSFLSPQEHNRPAHDQELVQAVHYKLQTRHGKALKILLGQTPDVEKFDKKHFQLKSKQPHAMNSEAVERYKHTLAHIQVKVLAERSKLKKEIAIWEKDYYLKHNLTAPTYAIMKADGQASLFLQKIKYADALLKQWDIS